MISFRYIGFVRVTAAGPCRIFTGFLSVSASFLIFKNYNMHAAQLQRLRGVKFFIVKFGR